MISDFIDLLFPKICAACDAALLKNEVCICTQCRSQLPLTLDYKSEENETKKTFYGRIPLEKASSLFYFEKASSVQNIVHDLKYRGNTQVAEVLGKWHASLLKEAGWYNTFDWVVPVPIHKKRLRERGYNQVDLYADAFAKILGASCKKNILQRKAVSKTQVFKNRLSRGKLNIKDFYLVDNSLLKSPKHILLVDDIITTGATLQACSHELLKLNNVKLSIASMGIVK
ncbi:ComF family protein [Psychroflexus salis]|uniref:Amidophosphoribosyltransferase n=1 Tax=Psychroflexus salis TaxID=1526574 RepID=A0A917A1J8_9FLAO|nr:ComF family protein [Psychroflexus salis]GGE22534.1 amidophosphoribosyltransferase [Psychroflexus salis]